MPYNWKPEEAGYLKSTMGQYSMLEIGELRF